MSGPTIRQRLYRVIFEHDTRAGRAFDMALLLSILLSVLAVADDHRLRDHRRADRNRDR